MKVCSTFQPASLSRTLSKSLHKSFSSIAFALLLVAGLCAPSYAQTASTTTLVMSSGGSPVTTISSFKPVTLTATVAAGGAPVTPGTVNFCFSNQTSCYGAALVGTAQLTSAGTAAISFRPGQGSHSYKAVFLGTTASATSTSGVQTLTVNKPDAPQLPTATTITSSGTSGNYTLSAAVVGNGNEPLSGNLNFVDLTHGNSILATEPLTSPVTSQGFMLLPAQTTPQVGTPLAKGDFNNDGIPDLISQITGGVGLQIGNGDLTFKTATALPSSGPVSVGDFNSDGNLDIALVANGSIQIYLGDGTGNLTALQPGAAFTAGVVGISTVDLNHDGILDLVAQDGETTHIFLGAGDGTFSVGSTFDITQGQGGVTSMLTGDFNADGIPDIAVAWSIFLDGSNSQLLVSYLIGDGTGNFTATASNLQVGLYGGTVFEVNPNTILLTAFDIDGDGKEDIVAAFGYFGCCPGQTYVGTINLINNGSNTPTQSGLVYQNYFTGNPNYISVINMTGDGTSTYALEFAEDPGVIGGPPWPPPYIYYSSGAPPGVLPETFTGGFVPGDFDGDGIDEVAVGTNSAMSIVGYQVTATATASNIAIVPAGSGTHQVEASYAGDPVHTSSVSTSVGLDSGIGTPTFQLSASSSVAYGSAVVITATLTSTGPTPTGTVTFLNGNTSIGTGTLTKGATTLSVSNLPLGKNSITATYPGDANNSSATAQAITITVTQAVPTVTLTALPTSAAYGSAVVLTAKLSGTTTIPTGNITFTSQSGALGTAALDKTGAASLSVTSLTVGQNSITAGYAGDTDNGSASSSAVIVTITKTAPALALSALPTSAAYGSAVVLTAKLSGTSTVPTGNITFTSQSGALGTTALDKTGTASLSVTSLAVGQNSITASYLGDTDNGSASSSAVIVTITKIAPTLALSALPTSAAYGSAVVLTAKLSGTSTIPTGNVTFTSQSGALGAVLLDKTGTASLSVTSLAVGQNSITASYAGDTDDAAVNSSAVLVTITKTAPTLTLTASPTSATYGSAVTLTAKLSGTTTTPTGSITFTSQSGSLGTGTLDKTGTATLSVSSLAAGSDSVTASFAGDADDAAVTSKALVLPVAPSVIAASALSTIYSGQADTISVTLGVGSNTTVPTGTVTLTSGSYTSAATALAAGTASISIPANTLAAGNDTITASYSGDTTYPASTGQIVVAVTTAPPPPPPGFTLTAPALSVMPGASTNNTVTVTLTQVTGFTGSVALSAQVTASPTGATDLPTVSFGSSSPVAITGSSPVTATLTISTSGPATARNNASHTPGRRSLGAAAGAVLACVLLISMPRRTRQTRRKLHQLLRQSRSRWIVLALAFALISAGLSSCGGGSKKPVDSGTTPGSYTITITGTAGTITSTGTVALTVQ